eukprot:scaffold1918_cov154-Amphora_coffeaeformis.AAC.5
MTGTSECQECYERQYSDGAQSRLLKKAKRAPEVSLCCLRSTKKRNDKELLLLLRLLTQEGTTQYLDEHTSHYQQSSNNTFEFEREENDNTLKTKRTSLFVCQLSKDDADGRLRRSVRENPKKKRKFAIDDVDTIASSSSVQTLIIEKARKPCFRNALRGSCRRNQCELADVINVI